MPLEHFERESPDIWTTVAAIVVREETDEDEDEEYDDEEDDEDDDEDHGYSE